MASAPKSLLWYAVAVHARQEKAAAAELQRRGVEVFLPARIERRAWSDRVQNVELALFPGYLFVHTAMSAAQRVELLKTGFVFDLVGRLPGDERVARHIPDREIESLRTLVTAADNLDPTTRLVTGARVRVAGGPLRGAEGVVETAADGKRRLVVQITLLGRGVRTTLSADDVVEAAA